jgi:hypothetical protein
MLLSWLITCMNPLTMCNVVMLTIPTFFLSRVKRNKLSQSDGLHYDGNNPYHPPLLSFGESANAWTDWFPADWQPLAINWEPVREMQIPLFKGEVAKQKADVAALPKEMRSSAMVGYNDLSTPLAEKKGLPIVDYPSVVPHWFVEQGNNSDGENDPPQPVPPPKETLMNCDDASPPSTDSSNTNDSWIKWGRRKSIIASTTPTTKGVHFDIVAVTDCAAPLPKLECKYVEVSSEDSGGDANQADTPQVQAEVVSAHGLVRSRQSSLFNKDELTDAQKHRLQAVRDMFYSDPSSAFPISSSPASPLPEIASPLSSVGFDRQGMMKVRILKSPLAPAALPSTQDWGVPQSPSSRRRRIPSFGIAMAPSSSLGQSSSGESSGFIERIPGAEAPQGIPIQRIFQPPVDSSSKGGWKPDIGEALHAPRYRLPAVSASANMSHLLPPLQAPYSVASTSTRVNASSAIAVSRTSSGSTMYAPGRDSPSDDGAMPSHTAGDFDVNPETTRL